MLLLKLPTPPPPRESVRWRYDIARAMGRVHIARQKLNTVTHESMPIELSRQFAFLAHRHGNEFVDFQNFKISKF